MRRFIEAFVLFTLVICASVSAVAAEPMRLVVNGQTLGGRWYECGDDGSTCDWGRVLAWEPHSRLVLSWDVTADVGQAHEGILRSQIAESLSQMLAPYGSFGRAPLA